MGVHMSHFLGVVILESLTDPSIIDHRVSIIRETNIKSPPDDPSPIWSRRLLRIKFENMIEFAEDLARNMTEDFYNHFVDDKTLVVVFKGKYFFLDKYDRSTWQPMVEYGETVRVDPVWTLSIPVLIY